MNNEVWEKETSKGPITIRSSTQADLIGIYALCEQEYGIAYAKSAIKRFRNEIGRSFLVAVSKGRIIGFIETNKFVLTASNYRRLGIAEGLIILLMKNWKRHVYEINIEAASERAISAILKKMESRGIIRVAHAAEPEPHEEIFLAKDKGIVREGVDNLARELGWRKVEH